MTPTVADLPRPLALVLSGGGTSGAVEVGFWKAIEEFGIRPDLIVGCSVGAINGAMIASGLSGDDMHRAWHQTTRRNIFRLNWRELWKGARARSLYSGGRFGRFLEHVIPARTFEELRIPFVAVASDLRTGELVSLDRGPLLPAVQASGSLPGIFPPVWIGDRQLVDGGITRMVPIEIAVNRGARTTVVGLAQCLSERLEPVRNFIETMTRSASLAVTRALRSLGYLESFAQRTRLIVLEPCFRLKVAPRHMLDFSHTDLLVKFGYEFACARLEAEGFPRPARHL